jgi:hypothetical protein
VGCEDDFLSVLSFDPHPKKQSGIFVLFLLAADRSPFVGKARDSGARGIERKTHVFMPRFLARGHKNGSTIADLFSLSFLFSVLYLSFSVVRARLGPLSARSRRCSRLYFSVKMTGAYGPGPSSRRAP